MKNHVASRILTGLATISCCALLLADSAEPYCGASKAAFDRTFDYTTTCNGEHSGRIRISTPDTFSLPVAGGRTEPGYASMIATSGELPNASVTINGNCADEDEPTLTTGVSFQFPNSLGSSSESSSSSTSSTSSGAGGDPPTQAQCTVRFSTDLGKHIDCKKPSDNATSAGCTLKLTALP